MLPMMQTIRANNGPKWRDRGPFCIAGGVGALVLAVGITVGVVWLAWPVRDTATVVNNAGKGADNLHRPSREHRRALGKLRSQFSGLLLVLRRQVECCGRGNLVPPEIIGPLIVPHLPCWACNGIAKSGRQTTRRNPRNYLIDRLQWLSTKVAISPREAISRIRKKLAQILSQVRNLGQREISRRGAAASCRTRYSTILKILRGSF